MAVVKNTRPMDARLMGLIAALKSCQLVFHAAPYKSGGKKIRKITSGFIVIEGSPGIRLMASPDRTSMIGNGNLKRLLTNPRKVIPNKSARMRLTFCIGNFSKNLSDYLATNYTNFHGLKK